MHHTTSRSVEVSQPGGKPTLYHLPVLYHQIIHALRPKSPGNYIDATIGAGGHAWGILDTCSPDGRLLGLDLDPSALELAKTRLAPFNGRFSLVNASYTTITEQLDRVNWHSVEGIVFDLGISSMQLDTPDRGFSFQAVGPLDMRFNPGQDLKAADLVNQLSENELASLIWKYGEEPNSRRIARAICSARPISTTVELAEVITLNIRKQKTHIHPATRTFQALRIAVNQELMSIEKALPDAVSVLAPGGRLAVISFHSLEDRIVKQFFRQECRDCICPPAQPMCNCGHRAILQEVVHRPIMASEEEIKENPRARSARLRIVEKRKLA
jgi:16S rRNA (cytosine1402-N4)-methyltransferase